MKEFLFFFVIGAGIFGMFGVIVMAFLVPGQFRCYICNRVVDRRTGEYLPDSSSDDLPSCLCDGCAIRRREQFRGIFE